MPQPLLAMKGISKSFGGNPVLSGVDFSLWPHEVPALLGEKGAGITALRIPPFIATLGALGISRGLALIIAGGMPVADLTRDFGVLATGSLPSLSPFVQQVIIGSVIVLAVTLDECQQRRMS
jgi:ribose/xylose/arabinose/galactoside ABC-type transport system permease subunit